MISLEVFTFSIASLVVMKKAKTPAMVLLFQFPLAFERVFQYFEYKYICDNIFEYIRMSEYSGHTVLNKHLIIHKTL